MKKIIILYLIFKVIFFVSCNENKMKSSSNKSFSEMEEKMNTFIINPSLKKEIDTEREKFLNDSVVFIDIGFINRDGCNLLGLVADINPPTFTPPDRNFNISNFKGYKKYNNNDWIILSVKNTPDSIVQKFICTNDFIVNIDSLEAKFNSDFGSYNPMVVFYLIQGDSLIYLETKK